MATYVMGDIHGEYDLFMELLDKIKLKDEDTLYILGDVIDRGPHPIKVLHKLMEMPNIVCLVGNHELMALECLDFLMQEITEESVEELDKMLVSNLMNWLYNGSKTTIDEFRKLNHEEQLEIIEFIKDFSLYERLKVNGKDYLLVHAGLGNFSPDKDIEDYSLSEIVWERVDYNKKYFDDIILVTGHTPTQLIESNRKKGYIYQKNNHIAIDCGACFYEGRLAAICLDTGKKYYSSTNKK